MVRCDVISLYFMCWSVNVSVCLVCCLFDSVCELFGEKFPICLGVVAILLFNVMEVFSVCGVALLDRPDRVWTMCWITGVCSPYVVILCDFAYYVVG